MNDLLFCNLKFDLPQCREDPHSFHLPYGLATIMEIASQRNVSFDFYDTYISGNTQAFLKNYQRTRHRVVLFSGIIGNCAYPYYQNVFSQIKSIRSDAIIVLGGPITQIYPDELMQALPVDIIVMGEGEETFSELLTVDFDPTGLSSVKGVGYRKDKDYILNPPRPPLKSPLELCSATPMLRHPSTRTLLETYIDTQNSENRGWDITATRGCYGSCTFCKKVFSKPIRYFSAEYIVNTMNRLYRDYGVDRFNFMDENFMTSRSNFDVFLEMLENIGIDFKWRIRSRIDNIAYDKLELMSQLGLYSLMVGLESGSQAVLEYYNKRLPLSKYKKRLREVARMGKLFISIIVGAGIETPETVNETIDFVRYLGIDRRNISVSFLSIIPGTAIFKEALAQGWIKNKLDYLEQYVGDFNKLELNISNMSDETLIEARERILQAAQS